MMASLGGHAGIAKRLLAAGAQVNRPGWTPLHYAAFGGNPELVRLLLERGADKNAVAPNGYTALMLAVIEGKSAAAKAILYEDPDLAHKGPAGESALGLAQRRGDQEMVELLKRAGAVE
jgi:ankyrin repeat protein